MSVSSQSESERLCRNFKAERVEKFRICKKLNIIISTPLRDPGEGLRRRTQSQIMSSCEGKAVGGRLNLRMDLELQSRLSACGSHVRTADAQQRDESISSLPRASIRPLWTRKSQLGDCSRGVVDGCGERRCSEEEREVFMVAPGRQEFSEKLGSFFLK